MTPSQAAQKRRHCLDCGRPLDMDPKVYDPEGIGCRTCDASQAAREKPTSPRTRAGQSLLRGKRVHARVICDIELEAYAEGHRHATQAFANAGEAAGKDSPATPSLDVAAFLDSLRTPRNSLGKLALPKGPMEWAVEEAWVPPAVEELDDSGDGVMIHRLSELADLIIDRLQARLARLDEGSATPTENDDE